MKNLFMIFIVAVLSMALSVVFEALVVKILVQQHLPHYPMRDAIRVPMIELLFNGITPFSTGGQPAQLFALMQSGVDGGRATSMLLMKFVVYQSIDRVPFYCRQVARVVNADNIWIFNSFCSYRRFDHDHVLV